MNIALHVRYGPFHAAYHRKLLEKSLREDFEAFIREKLLPQVDHPLQRVKGVLVACHDDDRFCQVTSAIRDRFEFELQFEDGKEETAEDQQVSRLAAHVEYFPLEKAFRCGREAALTVVSPERAREIGRLRLELAALIEGFANGTLSVGPCPICASPVARDAALGISPSAEFRRPVRMPGVLQLRCPQGCFHVRTRMDEAGRDRPIEETIRSLRAVAVPWSTDDVFWDSNRIPRQ